MSSLVYKYIPKRLDQMIGQKQVKQVVSKYLKNNDINKMQHLLFSGRAGVGKTTLSRVIKNHFYGSGKTENYAEFNASDERGIDFIREKVKRMASIRTIKNKRRIIFFDEMDNLTKEAQLAMRMIIESYEKNVLFIFSCNYPSKVEDAILSRFMHLQFTEVSSKAIYGLLKGIVEKEVITITDDELKSISENSQGDVRRAIINLEQFSMGMKVIDKPLDFKNVNIYDFLNYIKGKDLISVRDMMFRECINNKEFNKIKLFAEVDYRIAVGSNKKMQLIYLFNEFQKD